MPFSDPSLLKKIASALENAINNALTMSPGSQKHLKRLKGCILQVYVTSTKQAFFFGVQSSDEQSSGEKHQDECYHVVLLPKQDHSSVQFKGSALSFIKLASARNKTRLFGSKEIQLSGDSVRSQQIQAFIASVNIDWEAILASVIGSVPAHFFGSSLRNGFSWGKILSQSFFRDVEEFIKYEVRLMPSRAMATKQFAAIDQLYQATKNLETRIKQRLNTTENK